MGPDAMIFSHRGVQIKATVRHGFQLSRTARIKINKDKPRWGGKETSHTLLAGRSDGRAPLENNWAVTQNDERELTIWPHPILHILLKEVTIYIDIKTCTWVIPNNQKVEKSKCLSTDERAYKIFHTMQYYSAIKKWKTTNCNTDDTWKHYTKWRKLVIKTIHYMILLLIDTWNVWNREMYKDRKLVCDCQSVGSFEGGGERLIMGAGFVSGVMKMV